jgi:low temperature requirement protein LtrA
MQSVASAQPEPAVEEAGEPRRTAPVELLWDLVFVFAITQVTTLLRKDLTWAGFGRAMLVLALVWWAWAAYVWVTNAQDPDRPVLRASLLAAGGVIFITGLADPARLALCGGIALWMVGGVAFRLRIAGTVGWAKLAAAGACLLWFAVSGGAAAWVVEGVLALLLLVLLTWEQRHDPAEALA